MNRLARSGVLHSRAVRNRARGLIFHLAILLGFSLCPTRIVSGGIATSPSTNHWAFQPIAEPSVPRVVGHGRRLTPIDAFILQKRPSREPAFVPADKRTLLRRATFDLTGLPPTPEEIAAFVADKSSDAFSRVVERLLASPRYGEQWGRHWMDVVRYADTAGDNADYPVPEAHLYRDYIIDAFNADKPYDAFVREQLAGDILAASDSSDHYAERVIATGFLALSRRYATAPFEFMHLTIEDAIETTGRAFLGMTFRCARCHDHKYDPVTREDYYALYGIFESTRFPYAGSEEFQSKKFPRSGFQPLWTPPNSLPMLSAYTNQVAAAEQRFKECERELAAARGAGSNSVATSVKALETKRQQLESSLALLKRPGGPAGLPMAYAVSEGPSSDARVQLRGEPNEMGSTVPRAAPAFLAHGQSLQIARGGSGRLELARWLTQPDNPLTARVMVNRIWQHHFGRGLVTTPSNFGLRGDPPSHPELLDYLGRCFMESGWSIKAMHRLIMNSAVYQQASRGKMGGIESMADDQNYGAFPRRRLSAEEIRDGLLFVAGRLDLTRPGPHPFPGISDWQWTQHNPFKAVYESNHRSVYLMTQRLQRHPYLSLFDAPDANVSTDVRTASTVPLQALYVMNNKFMDEQATVLAQRLMHLAPVEKERLRALGPIVWGRDFNPREERQARHYLADVRAALRRSGTSEGRLDIEAWASYTRVLLTANEFFYVD